MTLVATALRFDRLDLTNETLLHLYQHLLRPRLIEEKMLILLRQGKVSKWFSGIGQEAISVGSTLALEPDEYILPLHRNLGVFTGREVPLGRLFAQWQGKRTGFTKGRDRWRIGLKTEYGCRPNEPQGSGAPTAPASGLLQHEAAGASGGPGPKAHGVDARRQAGGFHE